MADVFVSHDSADRAIAEQFVRELVNSGLSVWWDRHIRGGANFGAEIERELTTARVVLVLWSSSSLISDWVRDEAAYARDEKKLVPVRIDAVQPPFGFRQLQALDFVGWNGDPTAQSFADLLHSLRHVLADGTAGAPIATPDRPSSTLTRAAPRRNKRWMVAGVVAASVCVAALVILRPRLADLTADANNDKVEITGFDTLTRTDELERFAKGLGDTMVRVFATNGIRTVAGVRSDDDHGARAEFALRGTVDRDGDKFVIGADLLHRHEDVVLWSMTKLGDLAEPRILQQNFAVSVAGVLQCTSRFRRGWKSEPSNDQLGKLAEICGVMVNGPGEQLPQLTRRLVEAAPRSGLAYALEASVNAMMTNTRFSDRKPRAEAARLRKIVYDDVRIANELDPSIDTYWPRALVDDPAVGLAEREQLLQQSLAINPANWNYSYYCYWLTTVGRIRDALLNLRRALADDPLDQNFIYEVAFLTAWLGDVDDARRRFADMRGTQLTARDADDERYFMEDLFGDPKLALELTPASKKESPHFGCVKAFAEARINHVRIREDEIAACGESGERAYTYFGYLDAAFRELERHFDGVVDPIRYDNRWLFLPEKRALRADPRFMPFAARLGLVDYWLDSDQWPDFCSEEKLPYDCKEAALAARANAATKARASN